MPYKRVDGGYTTARGGFVRNPEQYEKLRAKGMSKERAAAITNSDNVHKSAFGVEHIGKADPPKKDNHGKEIAGGTAVTAVAANEGRAIYQNKHTGAKGRAASAKTHVGRFRNIRGISDAPAGTHFSQSTHPEGTYNISTASLSRARQKPAARRGQDQLRDSIRTKGFDRPVHMHIFSDGKARIWDGHHRTTRAAELGLPKIPVSVTHVNHPRPKPKSLTEAAIDLRHHRYRSGLLQASRFAKRGDAMISAFGIEHVELDKSAFGAIKNVLTEAHGGLKGGVSLARKGSAGSTGFKAGKFVRTQRKGLAIGAGAGLGIGAGLNRKNY